MTELCVEVGRLSKTKSGGGFNYGGAEIAKPEAKRWMNGAIIDTTTAPSRMGCGKQRPKYPRNGQIPKTQSQWGPARRVSHRRSALRGDYVESGIAGRGKDARIGAA